MKVGIDKGGGDEIAFGIDFIGGHHLELGRKLHKASVMDGDIDVAPTINQTRATNNEVYQFSSPNLLFVEDPRKIKGGLLASPCRTTRTACSFAPSQYNFALVLFLA